MTILKIDTPPIIEVSKLTQFTHNDLFDLCDATIAAVEAGGGFGWVNVPDQDTLERYWQGVLTMPLRDIYVARLDHVICGAAQFVKPAPNNEAQKNVGQLVSAFVAPWARGHGLGRRLIEAVEAAAAAEGFKAIHLDVRETQKEAIALYESMGYACFGTNPNYAEINGTFIPGRYYSKPL